jgi:diaminopropionate ammonia-lyase
VRAIANPLRGDLPASGDPSGARAFHESLEGYRPTPLVDVPALATAAGVGRVLVKDESTRLGLPAFKILGASWACHRVLQRHLGDEALGVGEVADRVRGSGLTFATATDGNHGRAVAHMARLYGIEAVVFVPAATTPARIAAIESEGARCVTVEGTYDDAVVAAAGHEDALVVSDTAWDGYEEIPTWIVEGYATMFDEIGDVASVTAVLVPVGVGALASAVAQWFRGRGLDTRLVSVEPETADCLYVSIARGEPGLVPGPHRSMMAGLNCGAPSPVAWPYVSRGFDAFVAIDDDAADRGMRALAEAGITSGETGSATTGALLALAADPSAGAVVELGADDTVLLLSTEGATDPAAYARIIGRPPPSP